MPVFSKRSQLRLIGAHSDLQKLANEVIKEVDHSVICGFRNEEEQEEAFRTGKSKVHWPDSKHNKVPAEAIDIVPYPVDWNDVRAFARLFGYYERVAWEFGFKLRWGGDFNGNWRSDDKFIDMPHIELIND